VPESNKTEQATPRKRQKAREQGQIARSRDLMNSLAMITAVLVLTYEVPTFAGQWRGLLHHTLDAAIAPGFANGIPLLSWTSFTVFNVVSLTVGLSWMAAMIGALAQGGLVFAPSALQPNLSRLSPATRMAQLFSLPSLGRLVKSLVPGSIVACLTIAVIRRDWGALLDLEHLNVHGMASFCLGRVFEISWKSALVLLLWSGADYMIEKHRLSSDLRMSRQDLKDEYKETEGHPAIKARIRRMRRQIQRRRMLEDVKRAAVVITNPTEFAIALEYRPEMPAPTVVAKGRNLVAQQIKEIARWHGIAVVENPPLAHALYRAAEIGQSIPPKLYTVVASILAAIYRAERASQAATAGSRGR
jgi:flagellar biosynthesis protein FlhB